MLELQVDDGLAVEIERANPEGVTVEVVSYGPRLGAIFTKAAFTLNDHQMDALCAWWAARKAETMAATYQGA